MKSEKTSLSGKTAGGMSTGGGQVALKALSDAPVHSCECPLPAHRQGIYESREKTKLFKWDLTVL